MTQIFPKAANSFSKASLVAFVLTVTAGTAVYSLLFRSPYVDEKRVVLEQPVPFSHKHHVGEVGLDCRFCHTSVESSAFAGIPPVSTCMTCHSQIWKDSPMLEPVRDAMRGGKPLVWRRVNALPEFVYFNHSIHVHKGIGCASCHGPVDRMPLTWRQSSLEMRWCVSCHEHPERQVRPREAVFDMAYRPPSNQEELGRRLVAEYHIQRKTDCVTCHR
ncbi:MAG TPA: cytochrome c3 family protein [Elusimicrobiota bacterium]|nr:cytochrome c3 family protein [Elusimicrobiota bacterium]